MKHKYQKLVAVLLCMGLLASCSKTSDEPEDSTLGNITAGQSEITVSDDSSGTNINASAVNIDMVTYGQEDYYTDWESQEPTYITLSGTTASIDGAGAKVNGSDVTIQASGTYVISGNLTNGQIIVDAGKEDTIRIVLNGADIRCLDSSPLYALSAKKLILSLPEDTKNYLADGEAYTGLIDEEPNAALFSKADLTINGTGTLEISARYNNGITGKDELRITGGNLLINAIDDGILGKDMVLIKGGSITVNAGGDGIKSTNDTDTDKGFIALEEGTFDIHAGSDGLQAETSLLITGGSYQIVSGSGASNGAAHNEFSDRSSWNIAGNTFQGTAQGTTQDTNQDISQGTEESSEAGSSKGLKASSDISIQGGTVTVDSADDSIHSNSSIHITGGNITLTSGDDGIHADTSIAVSGGIIDITKSYEGIESSAITVSDGEIHMKSDDDGFNIAGGNDGSSINGRPGQNTFQASGEYILTINGGYISMEIAGDGLDSNGSIVMTGGTVLVNGPTMSGNGSIDYQNSFNISGGLLITAGSSGMAQAPSEQSSQNSISITFNQMQKAGTLFRLQDSKGSDIVTYSPSTDYQTVTISSPDLLMDTAYTIVSGGTSTGTKVDGLYTKGTVNDGTVITEFTLTDAVTWLNEDGVTEGGNGFGGPGGFGRPQGQIRPGNRTMPNN